MQRSATASSGLPSTLCPAHSQTICGRTNTTRSPTRWSAACTTNRGSPTALNRISMASIPTSAAAPQTSTRDGPSLPPACSCSPAIENDGTRRPGCRRIRALRSPHHHSRHAGPYRRRNQLSVPRHSPTHHQSGLAREFPAPTAHSRVGRGRHYHSQWQPEPQPAAGTSRSSIAPGTPAIASKSRFPMQPRVSRWFNDSVAIERGPLVFSYGIGESWVKLRDRGMTADWQVYPTTHGTTRSVGCRCAGKSIAVSNPNLARRHSRKESAGPASRQGAQTRGMARRRWRRQSVPQSPVERTGGNNRPHPLCRRQAAHHGFPELKA